MQITARRSMVSAPAVRSLQLLTGAEIMDHVGWTRRHTALYYMQLAKVLNPAGASARLASNIGTEPSCSWQDINQLKRFVCAFPAVNRGKRSHEKELL